MNIEKIYLADIKPYGKNAKTHPKKQVELLAENIKRFGFTTPCLVDKDNNLIAGHGRLEAVKLLDWKDVPCVRMENLTDDEVKALRLADNKLAEMSEWDMGLVTEELKELDDELLDLGFDKDLVIELEEKDDEVPDVPEEPQSKLGDLYELGEHRVLCGDSTKIEDVERLMDGKKADMVFTDPPYGMDVDVDYDKMFAKDTNHYDKGNRFSKVIGDAADYNPTHIFEMFSNVKEMILWGADYYRKWLPVGGSWYCWDKRTNEQMDKVAGNTFELAWSLEKHKREVARLLWSGHHGMATDDTRKRVHPTQKPVLLIEWFFKRIHGEMVVDLFLGSGSTLIAAEKTGRICYGMELDPKYIDVIVQRYVDYTGNAIIKKNGEEITWKKIDKKSTDPKTTT